MNQHTTAREREFGPALRAVHVDHSSQLGGGQLGLLRYLNQTSRFTRSVVLFEGGPLASRLEELKSVHVRVLSRANSKFGLVLSLPRLRRHILEQCADAVVANSLRAAIAIALLPLGRVTRIYYIREDLSPRQISGLKRLLVTRILLRRFDAFLANSEWSATTIPENLLTKPVKIAYPVSGYIPRKAEDSVIRETAEQSEPIVTFLGRISEWKGVHILIEAAHRLKARRTDLKFSLCIAGAPIFADTDYLNHLHRLAEEGPTRIQFLGHVDNVDAVLQRSSIMVHASVRPEPFGQVIVQALGNGIPLIATSGGGPSELLTDGENALLVNPGDPHSMSMAMEKLLSDRHLRESLARSGEIRAASLTDHQTSLQLDEAIQELIQLT